MFGTLGRYSAIIATIVVFVLLVLTVLGLNFYQSFQVEANAEGVNLAGRQRMLSQRISKTLLSVDNFYNSGEDYSAVLNELQSATSVFDTTLTAFKQSGEVTRTDGGQGFLEAAETARAQQIIAEAESVWTPFKAQLEAIFTQLGDPSQSSNLDVAPLLSAANAYALENINTVLRLMNDLTNEVEGVASSAAETSRLIQTIGIIGALLSFGIITYLFFGQLRVADSKIEAAQNETDKIFDTVDQGLFLIDPDYRIGNQYSKEMSNIFGSSSFAGRGFINFIRNLVTESDLEKVDRYVKLLFDPHKKQKLISNLNPLNEVPVQIEEGGGTKSKFLRFGFSRVVDEGEISSVLTSVADVTKEVELSKQLEQESRRSEQQLELLSVLMNSNTDILPLYLENSSQALNKINEILKESSRSANERRAKIVPLMTLIHGVKGESAALSINMVSDACHEFEDLLTDLKNKETLEGSDFLPLTVLLDRLISYNTIINDLNNQVFSSRMARENAETASPSTAGSGIADWSHLQQLCDEVGDRQGRKANVIYSGLDSPNLPSQITRLVNTVASQFIRNSLSHGIEASDVRQELGKPVGGTLSMILYQTPKGGFQFTFSDDGTGIDFKALGLKAIEQGLVTAEQLDALDPEERKNRLLELPVSSTSTADKDSGRGVGLAAVREAIAEVDGRLAVKSRVGIGTAFTIRVPPLQRNAEQASAA